LSITDLNLNVTSLRGQLT